MSSVCLETGDLGSTAGLASITYCISSAVFPIQVDQTTAKSLLAVAFGGDLEWALEDFLHKQSSQLQLNRE